MYFSANVDKKSEIC